MAFAPPVVTQPVSAWTRSLLVTGAMPGATIRVRAIGPNPRTIADAVAGGGADWVALPAAVALQPGDRLVASQEVGGAAGPWTPDAAAYPVNDPETKPANLSAVTLNTRPYECGRYVDVSGAFPGATVEVGLGGSVVGTAPAPHGWARFQLTAVLGYPGTVTVRQVTPIGPGPVTTVDVLKLPFPAGAPLPAPTVTAALHGCEDRIPLAGVFDGATVVLDLSTGETYFLDSAFSEPIVVLPKPLVWNPVNPQTVTVRQTMPRCQRAGVTGGPVSVGPPQVAAPAVWGVCKGSAKVTVSGLNDKARVTGRVFLDGAELYTFTASGEAMHAVDIDPPLGAGDVYATQEVCGETSPPSASVTIAAHPALTTKPDLVPPLTACGRSVRVTHVDPGAEVQVFAQSDPPTGAVSAVSPRRTFLAPVEDLPVSPVLRATDAVWAVAIGCGGVLESPRYTVGGPPAVAAPKVQQPVVNDDTSVHVLGLVPTAAVFVYAQANADSPWELRGYVASAGGADAYVAVSPPLKTGQNVAAAQYYCQVVTPRGPAVPVVKQKPLAPKLLSPAANQKGVASPTPLTWTDPGAGTERKADTFDVTVTQGATVADTVTYAAASSYTVPAGKLKAGTFTTWSVVGRNSSGVGPAAQGGFYTLAPKPVLTAYDQSTLRLKGSNFPPNAAFTLTYRFDITGTIYFGTQPFTSDGRHGAVGGTLTADASGNVDALVDLYGVPTLTFLVQNPNGGFYAAIKGPLKGSTVALQATYQTPSLGPVSSDEYKFLWTKDTTLA